MYDTVNFNLEISPNDYKRLSKNEIFTKESFNRKTEIITLTGNLENYKINLSSTNKIYFAGSLCKFQLGNNLETLNKDQTAKAIQCFSDTLLLPIEEAKISRLDLAQNIITNYNPVFYYKYLGNLKYHNRIAQPKSIYYQNGLRKLLFYDKIEEMKNKRLTIPNEWTDKNVLRYEIRFTSRLKKEFNLPYVPMNILTDSKFSRTLLERWTAYYTSINKENELNIEITNVKTKKDFGEIKKIENTTLNETIEQIEHLRDLGAFKHNAYYSQLKKEYKRIFAKHTVSKAQSLIELDTKIEEAKQYAIDYLGF